MNPPRSKRHYALYAAVGLSALITIACFDVHIKDAWCSTDNDCHDPAYPTCDKPHHACQLAAIVGDMLPPDDLSVIACTTSAMCSQASDPICDSDSHTCRPCSEADAGTSSECALRDANRTICSSNGQCVQCQNNTDCVTALETCDTVAGSCVPCKANSDCASGICDTTHHCVDPTNYIYVNKNGPSCGSGGIGTGTLSNPFCTIQAGLTLGASKQEEVVVFSGTYAENIAIQPVSSPYTVNALGVGMPTIAPASGAAITILGQSIQVSFDGFVIQNVTGASGIACTGNGTTPAMTKLNLVRSTVNGSTQYGIFAKQCLITVDQTIVEGNQQGGISATDTDLTITNSLVLHNGLATSGGTYGGIYLTTPGGTATATIIGCTVYGNNVQGGVLAEPGISCPGTAANILNTVVHSNTLSGASTTTEINASACKPDHSAFVGAAVANTGTNNVELTTCTDTQLFIDSTNNNFTPKAGATCTLVDQGAASHTFGTTAVTAPAYDLIGTTRPQGSAFDIGCYEAP